MGVRMRESIRFHLLGKFLRHICSISPAYAWGLCVRHPCVIRGSGKTLTFMALQCSLHQILLFNLEFLEEPLQNHKKIATSSTIIMFDWDLTQRGTVEPLVRCTVRAKSTMRSIALSLCLTSVLFSALYKYEVLPQPIALSIDWPPVPVLLSLLFVNTVIWSSYYAIV